MARYKVIFTKGGRQLPKHRSYSVTTKGAARKFASVLNWELYKLSLTARKRGYKWSIKKLAGFKKGRRR